MSTTPRPSSIDLRAQWVPSAEWSAFQEPWNEISETSALTTVFQSFEWIDGLFRGGVGKGESGAVALWQDIRVVGLAPVVRLGKGTQVRRLLLLGGDYNDVLAAPGCEAAVVAAFARWIASRSSGIELADLRSLNPKGVLGTFPGPLASPGWRRIQVEHQPYPAIGLTTTFDAYEASLGKGLRRDFKQIPRRLAKDHGSFEVRLAVPATYSADIEAFFELHQRRWHQKGEAGMFNHESSRDFHRLFARAMLDQGRLRLYLAFAGGKPVGALYAFRSGDSVVEYLSGFDPEVAAQSPVKVLRARAIEDAVAEGLQQYDFVKGEEDYKLRWKAEDRFTKRILFGRRSFRAAFVMTALAVHPHLKALKRLKRSG